MFDGINPSARILRSIFEHIRVIVTRAAPRAEDAGERMEIRPTSFLLKNALLLLNTLKCGSGVEHSMQIFLT
jgi:hypothetical protein